MLYRWLQRDSQFKDKGVFFYGNICLQLTEHTFTYSAVYLLTSLLGDIYIYIYSSVNCYRNELGLSSAVQKLF